MAEPEEKHMRPVSSIGWRAGSVSSSLRAEVVFRRSESYAQAASEEEMRAESLLDAQSVGVENMLVHRTKGS